MSELESAKQWQARQLARGECRQCGNRIAPESESRCFGCLERARRYERQRRGILTAGKRHRGRPLLGTVRERLQALRDEYAWPRDVSPSLPERQAPVRPYHFVRLPGGDYQIIWDPIE
jgi:hypothetical protein